MIRLLQKLNILSIDVALGSVCAALFFAKYLGVTVEVISLVVLALTVWIIYTVDHLLDARKIVGEAASARHRFHQTHAVLLRKIVVFVAVVVTGLLFFLPSTLLYHGMALSVIVMVYILLHSYFPYVKELAVSVIYTFGVALPSVHRISFSEYPVSLLVSFVALALINLLLFSWFSEREDSIDGISSLSTIVGMNFPCIAVPLLLLLQFAMVIRSSFESAFVLLLFMSMLLGVLLMFPEYFRKSDRYRFGDVVFFGTLIYLVL
jgi:hypothetical protein